MSEYLENLIYYKQSFIITLYPTMAYGFYLFCKKYYKYMLHYNLLMADIISIDMYDNTYNEYNKETQTDEILIALNEIPT